MYNKLKHSLFFSFLCFFIILFIPVTVAPPINASAATMKLNIRKKKILKNKTFKLKVNNLNKSYKVSFSSSNKSIATVSSNGTVRGKKTGSTTITALVKRGNTKVQSFTCLVTVGPPAVSIKIIPESKTMNVNSKTTIVATLKPYNTVEEATFSSSNPSVATVSKDGVVTAHKTGKTTIRASISNRLYDTCKITVKRKTKQSLSKKVDMVNTFDIYRKKDESYSLPSNEISNTDETNDD